MRGHFLSGIGEGLADEFFVVIFPKKMLLALFIEEMRFCERRYHSSCL
jgi:hypothetical protein